MGESEADQAARLGGVIRRRRVGLGLSARHLGQRAQLSGSYVGFLESGRNKRPSIQVIASLAAALGATVDDLVNEAGFPRATRVVENTEMVTEIWPRLRNPERETLTEIGHALVRLQDRYEPAPKSVVPQESDTPEIVVLDTKTRQRRRPPLKEVEIEDVHETRKAASSLDSQDEGNAE